MNAQKPELRVIVGGLPRSGTTLFRTVLSAVPGIAFPPETAFFIRSLDWHRSKLKRSAARLNRALELGVDTIEAVLLEPGDSLGVFDRLIELYADKFAINPFRGWMEKTPRNAEFYSVLAGNSRITHFVSLIRDGRDVVTSRLPDRDEYHCTLERYAETAAKVLTFADPRHLIIRYEDMVTRPDETFARVFDFMNLPFDPLFLDAATRVRGLVQGVPVNQPQVAMQIGDGSIGRWRSVAHASRIEAFHECPSAVEALRMSGYE